MTLWFGSTCASRLDRRWHHAILAAGTAISLLALNLYAPAAPSWVVRILASVLVVAGVIPVSIWLSGKDRGMPLLPFLGILYISHYAMPIFLLDHYGRQRFIPTRPTESFEQALLLSLVGLILLAVGYYSVSAIRHTPRLCLEWRDLGTVKLFAIPLFVLGSFAGISLVTTDAQPHTNQMLADLMLVIITTMAALHAAGKLAMAGRIVLWGGLIPIRMWLGVVSTKTYFIAEVILLVVFVFATVQRRIPWMGFAGIALLFLFLLPVGYFLRLVRENPVTMTQRYAERALTVPSGNSLTAHLQLAARRIGHITALAEVVSRTPSTVPYWEGESYRPLLFKAVPRFILPDKPKESIGQDFGHRYGLLQPFDFETSYNLPQLVELYINFGAPGVLVGSLLLGMLIGLLQRVFVHPQMGLGALVTVTFVDSKLFMMENNLSMTLGGVGAALLLCLGVHALIRIFSRGTD